MAGTVWTIPGVAPLPEDVSEHPEAGTWLPVLIADVEGDRWCVRCPECGRPNDHSPEPGFRNAQCHCDAMREHRQISGYVIAPPGAKHAPYPDHCARCRGSGRSHIYTPVELTPDRGGRGVLAGYVCDRSHRWETFWGDLPFGPIRDERSLPRVTGLPRRCALYRHFDDTGVLLYVGISERPIHRGRTHAEEAVWVEYATRMEAEWLPDRAAAGVAEKLAIRAERPVFNRAHTKGDVERRIDEYLAARNARNQRGD